jgi:signal recognition particle subunit SRP54
MFDALGERLQGIFRSLRGETRINEAVLGETLREIRLALLEADVHVSVVKALLEAVRAKALGEEVLKSLSPGQQVVKIVRDELTELLGTAGASPLRFASKPPTVVLMVGLQGSGKTTTTAKLGLWLKKGGRYPYLVPADVCASGHRAAARGASVGLKGVRPRRRQKKPEDLAREGAGGPPRRVTPCSWTRRDAASTRPMDELRRPVGASARESCS